MRKFVVLLTVFVFGYSYLFAQPKSQDLIGFIKGGKLYLNKKEISGQWKVGTVLDILKAADRANDGYNKTHTYDRYGIVLFEKKANKQTTDTLTEIQFYFLPGDKTSNVEPSGPYSGKFKIENLVLSNNLTPTDVLNGLSNYKKTDAYLPHTYRLASNGMYIYFEFSTDETSLRKISIGRDMRGDD